MKKEPKILLACPTYDGKAYCLDYWAESVKKLQKITPCDVLLVDNSKSNSYSKRIEGYGFKVIRSKRHKKTIKCIGEARKKINDYLIKNNYDFCFSLEQDVFPDRDVLKKLLNSFKKIKKIDAVVAAPYYFGYLDQGEHPFCKRVDYVSCISKNMVYSKRLRRKIQNTLLSKDLKNKRGLMKVFAVGFGCCLIPVSVLKKVKVKYSENNFKTDDTFFYQDCKIFGISVYADLDLINKIKHIPGSNAPRSNGIFSWGYEKKK